MLLALAMVLAVLMALAAPFTEHAAAAGCDAAEPLPEEAQLSSADRALLALARELPLEVKVGQLLMPGFVGLLPDAGLLDRARRGHVGGFFLLQRNVRDAAQLAQLTSGLSEAAAQGSLGLRPLLATDFEGGTVNTLRAIIGDTPPAAAMASLSPSEVETRGAHDAAVLASLGFNTNLAPVADVLSAPGGIIGTRAFSSDPQVVETLSRAYLRGLQSAGMLGVMKHFPGHGSTAEDSHLVLPVVSRSLPELEAADLLPYRRAIAAGEAQAVMVGHLLVPALDPELPASLSYPIVTGLLRRQLGFDGLVITDELKMGAISGTYSITQAALLALRAGVDVILADYTGAEQDAVEQALIAACRSGQLPPGRIDRSVARILRLKLAHDLAGPDLAARYRQLLGEGETVPAPTAPPPEVARPAPQLGGQPFMVNGGAAGRLYVEAAGGGDFGYALTDEGGIALWQSYASLGGPQVLGVPISQRYEQLGSVVQVTQRAVLRWDPERQVATPVNIFDLFERAGALLGWPGCDPVLATSGTAAPPECSLDGWLEQQGIPPAIADDGAPDGFRQAVAARLQWLEQPEIRAYYLASPAGGAPDPWPGDDALAAGLDGTPDDQIPWRAIERYGLPASKPVRYGPFIAQRFQRAVLQLWLDDVPGMPAPGTVVPVPAGELWRAAGLIPLEALVPVALDGTPGAPPKLLALPEPPVVAPEPVVPEPVPPAPAPTPAATPVSAQPTPVSAQPTPRP